MNDEIKTTAEAIEAAVMPRCAAALSDNCGSRPAEDQPVDQQAVEDYSNKSPAEWAYERLIMYIKNFEEQLDNEHEVGMGIAGGDVGTLQIQGLGYYDPDIVTFYGADPDGFRMQLVQHVSQLNVMLIATPKREAEPQRIGFQMAQKLGEQKKARKKKKK